MTELAPYAQLGGFCVIFFTLCVTLATVVFYGGRFTQKQEETSKRVENIESVLYDENGIQEKVTRHEYHIHNVCKPAQRSR